jgi:enoyl-CoA hydratase/carnithine racemase
MSDPVTMTLHDGVAHVRLARPDKRNALTLDMCRDLVAIADNLANDRAVRVVVLSGEGPAFCSGLDLALLSSPQAVAALTKADERGLCLAQEIAWSWRTLPVPVIAAIHGAAVGAGLQLALATDIRIVHPEAKLGLPEVTRGAVPDMTAAVTLPGLLRRDVAVDLVLTGRIVSGTEGLRLGLTTILADAPEDDAQRWATTIAGHNPAAVRKALALLSAGDDAWEASQLRAEREASASLMYSPNQREAVSALMEHREPVFDD